MRSFFLSSIFLLFACVAHGQNTAAVGDLNGDGKPDVVVANQSLNNIGIFLNTGNGTLGPGTFLAVSARPDQISLVDLNGDGHLDILLGLGGQLQLMLGDGHSGFAAPVVIPIAGVGPTANTIIADFNGDGHLDIAVAANAGVAILFGDGHGGFPSTRMIPVIIDNTFAAGLVLLDANNDSKPDLVLNTFRSSGFLHDSFLLLNDGAANFSVSQLSSGEFGTNDAGWVTTVADFDGDGFPDLLFAPGSPFLIMFGDGHGGTLYTSPDQLIALRTPQGFATDVDGNQTIDLVSFDSYFPGNGHGGFGNAISLGLPQGFSLLAVADMNGDGKPDFIIQSGTDVSVVLNSFTAPANISASTQMEMSTSAATSSVGLPVTLSASMISYGGVPAGTVTFFEGAQPLGSAPVNIYGIAALTTSFSVAGLHTNLTTSFTGALNAATNTLFLNSNGLNPGSVSVNTSQPTAAAPTLSLAAFPNPARVRNPVTITATVASSSGTPTGMVVFSADGNVLGMSQVASSKAQLTVNFPTVALHNLQATYGGDAVFPQATSPALVEDVRVSVPGDFAVAATPQSATMKAGQSATFIITVNPVGDLASTVGFSCNGLPAGASCSFSPAILVPGINPVSTLLTINTTAAQSAAVPIARKASGMFGWPLGIVFGLLLVGGVRKGKRAKRGRRILSGVALTLFMASCGGGGSTPVTNPNTGTPAGISSITVTATSATTHTATLAVTVTP